MPRQSNRRPAHDHVPQQIDLFAENALMIDGMPAWSGLPMETQATLTALMTRLFLECADKHQVALMGDGHDH